jgi:hypothetical protein
MKMTAKAIHREITQVRVADAKSTTAAECAPRDRALTLVHLCHSVPHFVTAGKPRRGRNRWLQWHLRRTVPLVSICGPIDDVWKPRSDATKRAQRQTAKTLTTMPPSPYIVIVPPNPSPDREANDDLLYRLAPMERRWHTGSVPRIMSLSFGAIIPDAIPGSSGGPPVVEGLMRLADSRPVPSVQLA